MGLHPDVRSIAPPNRYLLRVAMLVQGGELDERDIDFAAAPLVEADDHLVDCEQKVVIRLLQGLSLASFAMPMSCLMLYHLPRNSEPTWPSTTRAASVGMPNLARSACTSEPRAPTSAPQPNSPCTTEIATIRPHKAGQRGRRFLPRFFLFGHSLMSIIIRVWKKLCDLFCPETNFQYFCKANRPS